MVACSIGPSPNDGHAHGGDMDWLSKLVGAENFWMAILLIPIKTVRLQARPQKPNDSHARGGGIDWLSKVFGAEEAWMTILLTPRKTDRFQDRPTPE